MCIEGPYCCKFFNTIFVSVPAGHIGKYKSPTMSNSKQILDPDGNKREDFKLKIWFVEITWGRLTIIGLCALIIILIFVLVMVKL
jgi:hypothetical protein